MPHCENCDHLCEQNSDGECLGRMTREERAAYAQMLVREAAVKEAERLQQAGATTPVGHGGNNAK